MTFTKVCIFGMGGVGGYFGGKMACHNERQDGEKRQIYFVARGAHLSEIRQRGLVLNTSGQRGMLCRPALATDSVLEFPTPDLYLLCVKNYDLDPAVRAIQSNMRPDTVILPLLNGVDIYERIRSVISAGIVLPACVYIGTHIESPGVVSQQGGDGTVFCGPDPAFQNFSPQELIALFSQSQLKITWCADPYPAIWQKYVFIAAFGLVTARSGKTLGQVMADEQARGQVRAIMEEVALIARRKGVALPADIVETSLDKAMNFPPETRTSYQRDVEAAARKNEGDLYGGAILRMGRQLGVPTAATSFIYKELSESFE